MTTQEKYEAIYKFIEDFWQEHGFAPSAQEVAAHIGLSDNATRQHLAELQSWGSIDWTPNTKRTLHITGPLKF